MLTEDSPLRANLDFSYAAHKLEVEYVAREFADEFPNVKMTIFRPAIVFGPGVDNAWSHLFETPFFLAIKGYDTKLQFVHEDDVLAALGRAVFEDLPGPYNLAPDGWLELPEMLSIVGRKRLDIPENVAFPAMERLWDMGLSEGPAGMVHYGMHPWLVDNSKLKATGFAFRYGNREAFAASADKLRSVVRIGSKRLQRSDLRRGGLTGLGVVGALLAARTLRRSLSRG
jgi:UDP-glucose 4-epimerase